MATKIPVTMVPSSIAPRARNPAEGPPIASITKKSTIGASTGSREGAIISRMAARVRRSTARPYSGRAFPSISPLISRNCRRTSTTTAPAARPTAVMPSAPKR